MCSDKWHVNGAPGQGEAPQPTGCRPGCPGRAPLGRSLSRRGVAPLPPGASTSSSGKWAPSQACARGLWVASRGVHGHTLWGAGARMLALAESAPRPGSGRQPGPGPPAPSLRRPTGRAPRDSGLPEPLATFVQGGERRGLNICIYIFNCRRNLPSGKDQRVPRAARGRGSRSAAQGPGFAAGVALGPLRSWAPDAGFVAPGKLSARSAWAPSAERGWGGGLRLHSPRCPLPRPPGDPPAVPCRPGLSFPDCSLPGRLTVSSPAPEGGGVISTKPREEGSGPP